MRKLIMLIENDSVLQSCFQNVLHTHRIPVLTASHTEAASHLLKSVIPDLIMINFVLFEQFRTETHKFLKMSELFRQSPILLYKNQGGQFGYVLVHPPTVQWHLALTLPCPDFIQFMLQQLEKK